MEVEDSHRIRARVGHFSTRRLIFTPVLDEAQLFLDVGRRAECPVSDIGDLFSLFPLPLELQNLSSLVHGHLQCQTALRPKGSKRELAPSDIAPRLVGPPDAIALTRRILGFAAPAPG